MCGRKVDRVVGPVKKCMVKNIWRKNDRFWKWGSKRGLNENC